MQASLRYHLNPPAQKILRVHEERPERQTGAPRRQSDQQVDVTRLIRVSPGHRGEDADIAKAVSLCEGADLGSVGLDQGVHFENASWRRGLPPRPEPGSDSLQVGREGFDADPSEIDRLHLFARS